MLELLTLILGLILCLLYCGLGRTVTSPSIIFVLSLFISSMISCWLKNYYSLCIELDTFLTIISGVVIFAFGEYFSRFFFERKNKFFNNEMLSITSPFVLKRWIIFVYLLVGLFAVIVIYQKVEALASNIGGTQIEAEKFLMYAQMGRENGASPSEIFPWWVWLFQIINSSLCYVTLYCYIYNNVFFDKLKFKTAYLLLPTVSNVFMSVIMMMRSSLIEMTVFGFTVVSVLWTVKYGRDKSNLKIVSCGIRLLVGFAFVFFYMRYLRGDGEHFDLIEDIFAYTGSEIPALDAWMQGKFEIKDTYEQYIGSHTLLGIYYFLGKIGIDVPGISRHMQFVFFNNNGYTNVYTIFCRYFMDFGYIGMMIILLCLGTLYGYMHRLIIVNKSIGIILIWYSLLVTAVYYSSVDELFFSSMVHPIYFFRLFLAYIFYRIIRQMQWRR